MSGRAVYQIINRHQSFTQTPDVDNFNIIFLGFFVIGLKLTFWYLAVLQITFLSHY